MRLPVLQTHRLELRPLDAAALSAMALGDAAALAERTGAVFEPPVEPPPLFGDEIPFYVTRLEADPADAVWISWLIAVQSTRLAVGVGGLGGGPGREGRFTIGYSVYPAHRGRGYATEAMERLLAWAFTQPRASVARATIPPWNTPSIRVAEKLGMTPAGKAEDREVGEVLVYELEAPDPRP
ncbi:MAG: GNAT family N-acetyltransferase [Actinomycetota bacterium]